VIEARVKSGQIRLARKDKDFDPGGQPNEPYDPYGRGPAQAAPDEPNAVREDDRTPFAQSEPVGDAVTGVTKADVTPRVEGAPPVNVRTPGNRFSSGGAHREHLDQALQSTPQAPTRPPFADGQACRSRSRSAAL